MLSFWSFVVLRILFIITLYLFMLFCLVVLYLVFVLMLFLVLSYLALCCLIYDVLICCSDWQRHLCTQQAHAFKPPGTFGQTPDINYRPCPGHLRLHVDRQSGACPAVAIDW